MTIVITPVITFRSFCKRKAMTSNSSVPVVQQVEDQNLLTFLISPIMFLLTPMMQWLGAASRGALRAALRTAWFLVFWWMFISRVAWAYIPPIPKYFAGLFGVDDFYTTVRVVLEFVRRNPDIAVLCTLTAMFVAVYTYDMLCAKRVLGWIPEKAMPGSTYIKPIQVPFQVEVQAHVDGFWMTQGQALRIKDEVYITPMHVVTGLDRIALYKNDKRVEISATWEHVHGDLALLRVTSSISGQLGVTVGKLAKVGARGGTQNYVHVTANGQTSFGPLTADEEFGMVKYGGSTMGGFSGAAYAVNNTIFGMHLGCDTTNLGYESTYLHAMVERYLQRMTPESTEDWLYDTMERRGRDLEYRQSPFDPDEIMVQVRGEYHVVNADDYFAARDRRHRRMRGESTRVRAESSRTFAPRDVAYTDSGNVFPEPARLPVGAGAPGITLETTPPAPRLNTLTTESTQPSASQEDCESNLTDHQQSTLAQLSGLLDSMCQERVSAQQTRSRTEANRLRRLRARRRTHIANGNGTSEAAVVPPVDFL